MRPNTRGFVYLPWLFILVMLGSLFWLLQQVNEARLHAMSCDENLRTLYQALLRFEAENGTLPDACLFPQDPRRDDDSLRVLLSLPESEKDPFVCPACHVAVREHGMSYLWNVNLNGTTLGDWEEPVWMLVDLQALDDDFAGPHFGKYQVLYTDGSVVRTEIPPRSLPVHH